MKSGWKRVLGLMLFAAALLMISAASADVEINESVFPDEGFRRYIVDSGFDEDGDGRLSKREIAKVSVINCPSRQIRSLAGIEVFSDLVELQCNDNQLEDVEILRKNKKLASLGAYQNRLTQVNLIGFQSLVSFSCSGNPVTELTLPGNQKMTWLDVTGTELTTLEIGKTPILLKLVQAGEPTPYIYGDMPDRVNWVTDTSFLAIDKKLTLTSNGKVIREGAADDGAEAAEEPEPAATEEPEPAAAEEPEPAATEEPEPEAADTPEPPAAEASEPAQSGAGRQTRSPADAEADGKMQVACLMNPQRNGFRTIWMSVPEHYKVSSFGSAGFQDKSIADWFEIVNLEGDSSNAVKDFSIQLFASGRWPEYGNLNEAPESVVEEAAAYYLERYQSIPEMQGKEMSVIELPSGLKLLKQPPIFGGERHFTGWTIRNGYEIEFSFNYPGQLRQVRDQDYQMIDTILNSFEEFDDPGHTPDPNLYDFN